MKSTDIALSLQNVSKTFRIYDKNYQTVKDRLFNFYKPNRSREIQAVKNVSFDIVKGECIGLIGRNGSGKSTLTKIMSGSFVPDRGGVIERSGTHMLLNLGVGFSHELTARENVYVNGSTLGLRISKIDEIFDQIIAYAELQDFVDTKIKYFSSGMVQRLSFSIAIYAHADILFLDEIFAVGDEKFRDKATKTLEDNWLSGRTVIIVSHSADLIRKYCTRTIFMHKGEMIFFGESEKALRLYREVNLA